MSVFFLCCFLYAACMIFVCLQQLLPLKKNILFDHARHLLVDPTAYVGSTMITQFALASQTTLVDLPTADQNAFQALSAHLTVLASIRGVGTLVLERVVLGLYARLSITTPSALVPLGLRVIRLCGVWRNRVSNVYWSFNMENHCMFLLTLAPQSIF